MKGLVPPAAKLVSAFLGKPRLGVTVGLNVRVQPPYGLVDPPGFSRVGNVDDFKCRRETKLSRNRAPHSVPARRN